MSSTEPTNEQSLLASRRPWSEFLDLSALDLPSPLSSATSRIPLNLAHFRFNYVFILLLVLLFSLVSHPLSFIAFFLVLAAWYFLFFSRDDPLVLFGFLLDDRTVLVVLGVVTVAALFLTHVWFNVFSSIAIGVFLVCLHATLRATDDQDSPYGALLSDVDSPLGAYSSI